MRGCRVREPKAVPRAGWGAPVGSVCKTRLGTGVGPVLGNLGRRGMVQRQTPVCVCASSQGLGKGEEHLGKFGEDGLRTF